MNRRAISTGDIQNTWVDTLLTHFQKDILRELAQLAEGYPREKRSVYLDWKALHRRNDRLATAFLEDIEHARAHAKIALDEFDRIPRPDDDFEHVNFRIRNVAEPYEVRVGQYSPSNIQGKLRPVKGQVTKVAKAKARPVELVFECQRCGTVTNVPQSSEGGFDEPHECNGCERSGPFKIDTEESVTVDVQKLRVQRPPEDATGEGSEEVDMVVEDDLANEHQPGERVVVNSKFDLVPTGDDEGTLSVFCTADSIEARETDFDDLDISEYKDEILEIANGEDPMQSIVDSIAPGIFGHDRIKEGIALVLFGAADKELPGGMSMRGTPHLLMIGDPGLGKTQMLSYISDLVPRAVFTTGMGSSAAGLTASAVQDDFGGGGWTIEAGTLVKANGGVAAIDELDKMQDEDKDGLLEAMSKQTVSVSKAGLSPTLPAKTSIVAGANPIHGRFDHYESIPDQFDLDPALYSRFDLIFPMADTQDEEHDEALAEHISTSYKYGQQMVARDTSPSEEYAEDVEPEIEKATLRAYIAYARENCRPVMSEEARKVLKQEYLNIRSANDEDGPVPTTPRSLMTLLRLSEAAARIRLSDRVTAEDAKRVVEIVRYTMEEVGIDPETGEWDADIMETGTSKSQRDRKRSVKNTIQALEDETNYGAPEEMVVEYLTDMDFDEDTIMTELDTLMEGGDIYETREGHLRVA